MEISSVKHAKRLVMVMTGRLDTNTSLQLEDEVSSVVDGSIEELVLDFSGIDYVSSAGLRVLLGAYKKMIVLGGKFKIIGVKAMVFDILEMTGMNNVFNIEKA